MHYFGEGIWVFADIIIEHVYKGENDEANQLAQHASIYKHNCKKKSFNNG